jgi:hypothetical protein
MAEVKLGKALKESIVGAKHDEIIQAGTLVVTRGTGVIAVALIGTFFLLDLLDQGPWANLDSWQKLAFVLASGLIWAIVAAADAIARGLATASRHELVAQLPKGLKATKTVGKDDPDWYVVAVKFAVSEGSEGPEFLIVKKGQPAEWAPRQELDFG